MEDTEELDGSLDHFSMERLEHISDVMAVEVLKAYNLWNKSKNRLGKVNREIDRRKNEGRH